MKLTVLRLWSLLRLPSLGRLSGLTGSVVDHRSVAPGFKPRPGLCQKGVSSFSSLGPFSLPCAQIGRKTAVPASLCVFVCVCILYTKFLLVTTHLHVYQRSYTKKWSIYLSHIASDHYNSITWLTRSPTYQSDRTLSRGFDSYYSPIFNNHAVVLGQ